MCLTVEAYRLWAKLAIKGNQLSLFMHAVLLRNILMSLLFKYSAVMSLKGLLEEQQRMGGGGGKNSTMTNLFLHDSVFRLCFLCFQSVKEKKQSAC